MNTAASSPAPPAATALLSRAGAAYLLGALFFAYAFLLRVSPSVMVTDLMAAFGVGAAVLGNLSAFYLYAYAGLQIPVGLVLDRLGARWPMVAGLVLVCAGTALFSAAGSITTAYLGRLLIGAGCAFSFPGVLAIINQWFPQRFALLAGICQLIAMTGAMLGQAPLAAVVLVHGWRPTTLALAGFAALLAVLLAVIVRDRPRAGSGAGGAASSAAVLRNPQMWLAALLGLAVTGPTLAFGGLWGVPFLASAYGLDRTSAAALTSLVFLGHGFGGVVLGWWSDRAGRRKLPLAVGGVLSVSAQLALLLWPGLPLPVVALLIVATGCGAGAMVLSFALGRENAPPAQAGLTMGIVNMAVVGGGALLQPLIGIALDLQWDGSLVEGARVYGGDAYARALLIVPVVEMLGLLALLGVREGSARSLHR